MVDRERRAFLATVAGLTVGAYAAPIQAALVPRVKNFGAVAPTPYQYRRLKRLPSFHEKYRPLMGFSYKTGDVHLWKNLERAMGSKYVPHDQIDKDGNEAEGDCLGHATALGCDVLAASDIHFRREPERIWPPIRQRCRRASSSSKVSRRAELYRPTRLRSGPFT